MFWKWGCMAYDKEKAKSGMEGKTSQTERWGTRADIKKSTKKKRRKVSRDELMEYYFEVED